MFGNKARNAFSSRKNVFILAVLCFLLVTFIFLSVRQLVRPDPKKLPESAAEIVAAVARHMDVPQPALDAEKISDPEALRHLNPDFYQSVAADDWVVRYKLFVVIYRPSTDKVIAVSPASQTNK